MCMRFHRRIPFSLTTRFFLEEKHGRVIIIKTKNKYFFIQKIIQKRLQNL